MDMSLSDSMFWKNVRSERVFYALERGFEEGKEKI